MMKPDPSEVASRVTGRPSGVSPPWPKRRKSSSNGVPENGLALVTSIRCVVEMLTTAGCKRAARSAKLSGAPARGTTGAIAPGAFCATCAPTGCWSVRVAVAPPASSAAVMA
jgi:hypothetical protein